MEEGILDKSGTTLGCWAGAPIAKLKNRKIVGFILVLTVAIAAGIHLIGTLLLAETTDQTRLFVMSLPISLLDYSIGKISVVLTTYLIPWTAMFTCLIIATFVIGKQGNVVVLPVIFFYLLSAFMLQLVAAVVSESVGWTICVMVGCNLCSIRSVHATRLVVAWKTLVPLGGSLPDQPSSRRLIAKGTWGLETILS